MHGNSLKSGGCKSGESREPFGLMLKWITAAILALGFGCATDGDGGHGSAEGKAVAFLSREVPAWAPENRCYSCHNNGDAARALYAASRRGYSIARDALADTTRWVTKPDRWDHNKGDPAFSDKRLANIQFAASLAAAVEAEHAKVAASLKEAARKVAADQDEDGAWRIDAQNTVGSPATYGITLATLMAWRVLKRTSEQAAMRKAESWLQRAKPRNVPEAATLLWASAESWSFAAHRAECLKIVRGAQTPEGGWGPYADAPPEPFDTALVLLALADLRGIEGVEEMIARGRQFLIKEQNADGSWPATTRPRGGESYAQQMSTTGWATLALLKASGHVALADGSAHQVTSKGLRDRLQLTVTNTPVIP